MGGVQRGGSVAGAMRSVIHLIGAQVLNAALAEGLRAEIDVGGRSIGKQIKVANAEKVRRPPSTPSPPPHHHRRHRRDM